MTRLPIVILATLLMVVTSVPATAADVKNEAEKAAIAQAIDGSISWFATKDFDLCYRVLADDPDLFWFSPDSQSTVHGKAAFVEHSAIWRDPANRYVSHEIRDLRIHLHPSGDVAWFSAILDDCGEYNGQVGCWKDTRWTGVLEKREGRWVIMQQHFSFAVDQVRDRIEKRVREELAKQPKG